MSACRVPQLPPLSKDYHYESVTTQTSHDAGSQVIPYTTRKINFPLRIEPIPHAILQVPISILKPRNHGARTCMGLKRLNYY